MRGDGGDGDGRSPDRRQASGPGRKREPATAYSVCGVPCRSRSGRDNRAGRRRPASRTRAATRRCCRIPTARRYVRAASRPAPATPSRARRGRPARTARAIVRSPSGNCAQTSVRSCASARPARRRRDRRPDRRRSRRAARACAASRWPASRPTLNCACPPGRCMNSTSSRATASAVGAPQSASTSARHRSMPAVTPADVWNGGSLT